MIADIRRELSLVSGYISRTKAQGKGLAQIRINKIQEELKKMQRIQVGGFTETVGMDEKATASVKDGIQVLLLDPAWGSLNNKSKQSISMIIGLLDSGVLKCVKK